jgi:predicted HNH restriction endonuclease
MLEHVYDQIREENKINYGTKVGVYGPILLGNLYSERTHFIFELLQNAEDACARARKTGDIRKFIVNFSLFPDRLEVSNNGIQFDGNDVRGICGIVDSTKDQRVTQIGKFGIGFKSVYAYTVSPEVFSGEHSFSIKDLVHPFYEKRKEQIQQEETVFIIPFNKPEVKPETAFEEIKKKLSNLGLRSMLFLNNIEEISFKMGSNESKYNRSSKKEDDHFFITLRKIENGIQKSKENWLVFEKLLDNSGKHSLKTAYLIVTETRTGNDKIMPAEDALLFVYFPTEIETHLKFIIHGPFNTTPARDNINKNDQKNLRLIQEIGEFVAENMTKIKQLNLFDVDFLNSLPIDTDHFAVRESIFRPIYEKVKDRLSSNEALLPTYDKSYTTSKQALISRSEDMRKLVSSDQLNFLFDRENSRWLDPAITENRTPELWKYLTCTLLINVIDSDTFAKSLTETFFKQQTDEWIILFYDFLGDQKALWRENEWGKDGILRSKPIIRLENDSHKSPFDFAGKPNVYLASKDPTINIQFQNIIKSTISSDKRARGFLKALGIEEPDISATVMDLVLPLYGKEEQITDNDNFQHVKMILQSLGSCSENKKENLLAKVKKIPFLKAVNPTKKEKGYKKPTEIHLGKSYTGIDGVEAYFSGNNSIWFLDESYVSILEKNSLVQKLREIGCISGIWYSCAKPDYMNHVIIDNSFGWHSRGLNGFDPNCEIEGLEFAVKNINVVRAKIIWQFAMDLNLSIYGEVEKSTKQDYQVSSKQYQYSKMGQLLHETKWIPDLELNFHEPRTIKLSEMPDDFEKVSIEAKNAAEKIGIKSETNQEIERLCANAPEDIKYLLKHAQPLLDIFNSAGPEQRNKIIESARQILMEKNEILIEDDGKNVSYFTPTRSELLSDFTIAMKADQNQVPVLEDKTWVGPTPEQEVEIQKSKLEALSKMSEDPQVMLKEEKLIKRVKSKENSEPNLRAFLLNQYHGNCQVCNERLDLGIIKDPYFEIYRLDEKKNLHGEWSNQEFNTICLCPNCHALMKYGGRDLTNIVEKAKIISNHEEVPEPITERNGDFYAVKVSIAGKEREIFYAPSHMASIIAFLKFSKEGLRS